MLPSNKIVVTTKEFEKLRYETTLKIISGVVTLEKLDSMEEHKQRQSLIYNCLLLADAMLEELGYQKTSGPLQDKTGTRNLKDLLSAVEEE